MFHNIQINISLEVFIKCLVEAAVTGAEDICAGLGTLFSSKHLLHPLTNSLPALVHADVWSTVLLQLRKQYMIC